MKTLTIIIAAALLSGCAAMIQPSAQEAASANYGAYPSNHEEIIRNWIKTTFFDPYTVQDLSISTPQKSWNQAPPLLGGATTYGYEVKVTLNARNRLGGYTGLQTHRVLIRNGRVVSVLWHGHQFTTPAQ